MPFSLHQKTFHLRPTCVDVDVDMTFNVYFSRHYDDFQLGLYCQLGSYAHIVQFVLGEYCENYVIVEN